MGVMSPALCMAFWYPYLAQRGVRKDFLIEDGAL
jgi:hypothetical protein